jgi:putative CGCGG family rSAM target protein
MNLEALPMSNWSINLETEEYVADRNLIIKDAITAILETEVGCFVNLAAAENHGNPDDYLVPALKDEFRDSVKIQFIDQCGCGGYVYKVYRLNDNKVSS